MPDSVELPYDDCIAETDNAFLLILADGRRWVPKSVIDVEEQIPALHDDGGEFKACFVRYWWAREKGLI